MYLFDASSILNLVKRGIVKPFSEGVTVDLAFYESINAVWKEYAVLRKINENTAVKFIDVLGGVFRSIDVLSAVGLEDEVFKTASEESITVHDASYLCLALKNRFTLVTDDGRLKDVSSKYVKTVTSRELSL